MRNLQSLASQLEWVRAFIDRMGLEVHLKEHYRGNKIGKTGSAHFGSARYNGDRQNAGKHVGYTYYPLEDAERSFQNEQAGKPYNGWKLFVDPEDAGPIRYALRVLRSVYEER